MITMSRNRKFVAMGAAVALMLVSSQAAAIWPVIDAAVQLTLQLMLQEMTRFHVNATQLLQSIGQAINDNGAKISSTVEVASRAERELSIAQEKTRRIEDARQRYVVPDSICSESASGGAVVVGSVSSAIKSSLRPAGGATFSNAAIASAINSPAPASEIDSARSAKIHSQYCDYDDFNAYGGSSACPSVSKNLPGADKRLSSLLIGAGPNAKLPDLTFNQTQTDVARMYTQNTVRRSIAPQLQRGQVNTTAGAQYIGLMNQYNAVISAAADPQDTLIAESQANPATKDVLKEALATPSAASYFRQFASAEAKRTGLMSSREFESFEVGRRYANTDYQTDLQSMAGDNLIREQIRVASLTNWLLLSQKIEMTKGNVIQGQLLATQARNEYTPILLQKYRAVSGRLGGN